MKKIKAGFLGVMMMVFCMCIMVMTPNTAYAETTKATDSNASTIDGLMAELEELSGYEITVKDVIEIDGGEYTVDLNKNTVIFDADGSADAYFYVKKGTLILKNGKIDERDGYAAIKMTGSTVSTDENYSNVVIKPSATIKGDDGILLRYTEKGKSYGMTVDMQGHIEAANVGINVNGDIVHDENTPYGAVITVSGTIKATNEDGVGIYQAGYANTTISGSTSKNAQVVGKMSGIEVRAGKLTVNDNTQIIGEAVPANYEEFYNGSTIYGAGVAVSPHSTSMPITVKLNSGAIIEGYRPVYVVESNNIVPDVAINGATLRLTSGATDNKITYSEMITISNGDKVILDLNGNTLEFDSEARGTFKGKTVGNIFVENGDLTVRNGSIHEVNADYAPIMVSGSTNKDASKYSVVTIDDGVSLFGWSGVFVRENGNAAYGVEVTMNGNIVTAADGSGSTGSGIYINGNITKDEGNVPKITIGETGTIFSAGVGIFMGGYADVTVNGSDNSAITGDESGIEVRAGKLTVNGGLISSNYGNEVSVSKNGNGSTTKGAGIAIAQHTTRTPIEVVINDGKINGTTAVYESNPEDGASTDVTLEIKGGSFTINGVSEDTIFSENLEQFISAGLFASAPKSEYIVSGYKAAMNADGQWEIVVDGSVPVMFEEGDEITVFVGEEFALTAITTPEMPFEWEFKDDNRITYDEDTGLFVANRAGDSWVKAVVKIGGNETKAKCTIHIVKQKLSVDTLALAVEEKATLSVSGDATKGIVWSSEDSTIATVDQNGIVTAVSAGTTTITATVNKIVNLSCTVTVSDKEVAATQGNTGSQIDFDVINQKKEAAVSEAVDSISVPDGVDAEAFKEEVENAVAGAISDTVESVESDILENTVVTQPVEGLAEAAETVLNKQELEENEKALVYVNIVLEDVDVDVTTTVDENNDVTATAVPAKLTFTIEPFVKVFTADGELKKFDGEDAKKIENKDLNGSFKVRLPIPSSITDKYASIVHKSEGYSTKTYTLPIKEENGEKYVEMTLTHFSTFEVSFTNTKPSTGSSSSGGSYSVVKKVVKKDTVATGAWVQDANGWWYRYTDGTWPAAKWVELDWNGQKTWYYFDQNGYMHSGWLLDGGLWYFLHNISDGTQGYMYTGWQQIEGKWYYFNPLAGGPKGSLLVNTVTPDGYTVDANGVWVQ